MVGNADALRGIWDAWSRGSVAELVALLHPEVEWSSVLMDRTFRGHGDVEHWLDALTREWKSLTVTFDHAEDAGPDRAVAHGRVRGFRRDGGEALDTAMILVAEFRDGLMHRGWAFTDAADARRHLGGG